MLEDFDAVGRGEHVPNRLAGDVTTLHERGVRTHLAERLARGRGALVVR